MSAVATQVVRSDRGGDLGIGVDELDPRSRRDMLERDGESRPLLDQRHQLIVEKGRLSVEDIDIGPGRFGVHEEPHTGVLEDVVDRMER
ncbi:MAG: hypothetical protein R2710_20700 [Acidimicrobiales bacterium]